ncbi:unnamed protein product, partial [Cyprideis torosa]
MKDKLAIIVPYRDRQEHLDVFVPHMREFFKDKGIDYEIFIAEQTDDRPFNYGKLCNVVVKEIGEEYTYFAFHDIDMLPISDDCDYGYPDSPTHLATNVEAHENKLPYPQYFGGVVLISREDFENANGYSNEYWGYGFEDLDLLYRLQRSDQNEVVRESRRNQKEKIQTHKLGIIVPYRDRPQQLKRFISHMEDYLKDIEYEIFIVEQSDAKPFNRGKLLNVGYKSACDNGCDYFVFHDVDMLPENVDYSYSDKPLHLATHLQEHDYETTFFDYFGGVTMFTKEDFKTINGFSNEYWGWGFEDDDLLVRCIQSDLELDTETTRLDDIKEFHAFKFDGEAHLKEFIPRVGKYLEGQGIDYQIYFAHQVDDKLFNRGATKNIAAKHAFEDGCDYIVWHDIDMIPDMDGGCDYTFPKDKPRHIATNISQMNYELKYEEYFGGAILFSKEQVEKTNGYSNDYWDWGMEDDDLFWRCVLEGYVEESKMEFTTEPQDFISFNGKDSYVEIPCT